MLISTYKNKKDIEDCGSYRGTKLLFHTIEVWKRIIEGRLGDMVYIREEQLGRYGLHRVETVRKIWSTSERNSFALCQKEAVTSNYPCTLYSKIDY